MCSHTRLNLRMFPALRRPTVRQTSIAICLRLYLRFYHSAIVTHRHENIYIRYESGMKMPIEFHFIPVHDNMYLGLKESAGSSGRISRFSNPNSVEAASTRKRKAARTRLRNIKSYAKVTSIASYTWLATKYPARPPSKQNISSGFSDDAMISFSFRFISDRSELTVSIFRDKITRKYAYRLIT